MIVNMYLFCFMIVFLGVINALPYYRFRRQINSPQNDAFSHRDRPGGSGRVSGSIMGTYYYGIGTDPNYGSFISKPNTAGGNGIVPISYDPNSNLFGSLVNPNYQHQQQQQQQSNYLYNSNNNNAWQRPSSNNYNNQFGNRYPPGSQGWYATGGNYWYNHGQSVIVHPYLLLITIVLLIFCK